MSTHTETLYESEKSEVMLDLEDDNLPIKVRADADYAWLNKGEAYAVAQAILAGLKRVGFTPPAQPTEATPATVHAEEGDERTSWNKHAFEAAAKLDLGVRFSYAKGDGNVIEQRQMRPHDMADSREGHTLVTGYDLDRDEPRVFRLDRVKGYVEVTR